VIVTHPGVLHELAFAGAQYALSWANKGMKRAEFQAKELQDMPEVTISEDMYDRIMAFKQVVEVVLEEPTDLNTCVELLLNRALECMLADILDGVDRETLLKSFQQLASQHPTAIYQYVAEIWRGGGEVIKQEEVKRRMGLIPPK
jgi:hypothetical protein